jgi:3-oxoadipate enol-lactonase
MPKIEANGINIYYECHGPVQAAVLVLNNGIIMNAATSWSLQTATLAKHYRLIQYDMRGQGQSDHPDEEYSMELHADDLDGLLERLGIEKAHIAGISYGGEVAQAFVLKYPERSLSLILADTVSEIHDDLAQVVRSWIDALQTGDPSAFFDATVSWNFSPQFIQGNQAIMDDAKKRYATLDFPAVRRLCECFLEVDFTSRLPEIKAPTCVIVGEQDQLKGIMYAKIIQNAIHDSELHILEGAGHATCWESSGEFNNIILHFLAKQKEPVL